MAAYGVSPVVVLVLIFSIEIIFRSIHNWITKFLHVFTFCSRQMDVVEETGGLIREPIITICELSDYAQGLDEKDKRQYFRLTNFVCVALSNRFRKDQMLQTN
ncbi:hypothetical protein OUZ56_018736 [Daphnia magna]|uniref:Uncharacterized protein n=1 Tax=Daphnia magna TaxID=35525 RepID=A0ABQ9Z9N6_9CRUS|nr:hypothetical protein OUZ56_018736 [Daphnia magna]